MPLSILVIALDSCPPTKTNTNFFYTQWLIPSKLKNQKEKKKLMFWSLFFFNYQTSGKRYTIHSDLTVKRKGIKGIHSTGENVNCVAKRVTKLEVFGSMGWESEEGLWERTSYYIKSYTFWCSSSIAALGFEGNCDFFFFFFEKWYVHNIFTTNFKWQIVTGC